MRKTVSRDEWLQLDAEEQKEIIHAISNVWRYRGFPHYNLTHVERLLEFDTFQRFDRSNLIQNKIIGQTLHALGMAWHYFPHHWEVRVQNRRTAWDVWNDDDMFHKAIASRLKWGGYQIVDGLPDISPAYMRKALRTYSGVQRVSNFRPSASAIIYDTFCDGGTVWDMSCGYGGRLIGAIASPNVKHYIGTDPANQTMQGLKELRDDFAHLTKTQVSLHQMGSEEFVPEANSVDLCFTSPPYFDTETYALELTQSYMRYNNVESWNNDFLRVTIQNCRTGLRKNGKMLLNVADVKSHPNLVADTIRIAEEEGFTQFDTLQLALSSISKGGHKYEPVLCFTRES
jgi:hypothetical protein